MKGYKVIDQMGRGSKIVKNMIKFYFWAMFEEKCLF